MSITLEKFLPKEELMTWDDEQMPLPTVDIAKTFNTGFNNCRTEASKVEIGLSREKIIEVTNKFCDSLMLVDALLAAESELIVKKINHPPQGEE